MTMRTESVPEVTVITPVYNASAYILKTIESVQNQSHENWEMIVVDDASSDDSVELIQEAASKDGRIRCVELPANSGAAVARNTGIKKARGAYLAFLDSDDLWAPDKLTVQLAFMKEKGCAFSHTAYEWIDDEGRPMNRTIKVPEVADYHELLKENRIGCLTVMVNLAMTGSVKMPNIRARQDYALWLELARKGMSAYGVQQPLAYYRERKVSLSSNKIRMAKLNWYVYRHIEQLPLCKSVYYFMHFAVRKMIKYAPGR